MAERPRGGRGAAAHPGLPEEIRRLARKRKSDGDEDALPLCLSYKVHVASVNNFPTAAGLASSAAGFACLACALARVYGVEGDLSEVARRGSGSACRSLYGGFVEWQMGQRADGKDSIAQQVAPESHWPELRVLILVVSAEKKLMGSTAGMQTSVETSALLRFRAKALVPARMAEMARCIRERDFQAFGQLTMKDSNQFHATCLTPSRPSPTSATRRSGSSAWCTASTRTTAAPRWPTRLTRGPTP